MMRDEYLKCERVEMDLRTGKYGRTNHMIEPCARIHCLMIGSTKSDLEIVMDFDNRNKRAEKKVGDTKGDHS